MKKKKQYPHSIHHGEGVLFLLTPLPHYESHSHHLPNVLFPSLFHPPNLADVNLLWHVMTDHHVSVRAGTEEWASTSQMLTISVVTIEQRQAGRAVTGAAPWVRESHTRWVWCKEDLNTLDTNPHPAGESMSDYERWRGQPVCLSVEDIRNSWVTFCKKENDSEYAHKSKIEFSTDKSVRLNFYGP